MNKRGMEGERERGGKVMLYFGMTSIAGSTA